MATVNVGMNTRITFKRKRPNPLFQKWLESLLRDAKTNKSKIEPMLREALTSLSKYPLPLRTGAECAILKGFDSKLCKYLDKHLEEHYRYEQANDEQLCNDENAPSENLITNNNPALDVDVELVSNLITESPVFQSSKTLENNSYETSSEPRAEVAEPTGTNSQSPTSKNAVGKKSKERKYKPAYRSGAYAILVGLLEQMQECPDDPSINKEDLIERAQKHSEESFVRAKPETFYTAWSNITRLVTKGLVLKQKKKKMVYSLTPPGVLLATELLKELGSNPTVNDIIFNTPATASSSSSQDNPITESVEAELVSISSQSSNASVKTIEMPAGSFEVILLIDKNETGGVTKKNDPTVAQFNKYPDLKHEYRSLKVGDFTWIARHKINKDQELVLPYVVERKRMDDLGSSIKDGRFHEQKFRLRKCGLRNVIYMVENYGSNQHVGLPLQSLMQALANTRVQDGFKVHTTDSLNHSARFLAMMTKRLTIEFKDKTLKGYNRDPTEDDLMTFEYFNKSSSKTKPLTVTETFIKLLLQLKGVSVEKALAITNTYCAPASLIKAYGECSQKDGEMLLANLKYGETGRNVGPKTSKSVYQLFTKEQLI